MISQMHRQAAVIDLLADVDGDAVHHTVHTAVQNDALDIGQRLQLLQRNIMGMDLTVDAQGADFSRESGVFITAQVENDDHILLHCFVASYVLSLRLSFYIAAKGRQLL